MAKREPVYRCVVKVVVMARKDDRGRYGMRELHYLEREIYEGPCLGDVTQSKWRRVLDDKVVAECRALGNDGTFFDDEDDEVGEDE